MRTLNIIWKKHENIVIGKGKHQFVDENIISAKWHEVSASRIIRLPRGEK